MGAICGLSGERIRQLEKLALRKLLAMFEKACS
jgi:DNA-directed RNA polymerase sigma subunit (sigma70/sigma32)